MLLQNQVSQNSRYSSLWPSLCNNWTIPIPVLFNDEEHNIWSFPLNNFPALLLVPLTEL
jgi:hypothetical protein